MSKKSESGYYENQPNPGNLVSRLALSVRLKMYEKLMEIAKPNSATRILDVGVTNDKREESNFLEKLYPHKENITAVGLEDALFLQDEYPGLKYIKANGCDLPFENKSYDLVTSFAVVEHVGNRANQRKFVQELARVGKSVIISTPNRWYPMEVHTMMPIAHWLPPSQFRKVLKIVGKEFYAQEENLNLLESKSLIEMFPTEMKITPLHHRLLGVISNLYFYAEWR
jgi:2-polyprenyl-3-methyl-5-hydroxy-6-metoxy-1,4-benzoquinol methylase